MTELEKIIKGLENLHDSIATDRMPDAHKAIGIISDAIELLKEQEAVVRCKDCQFYNEGQNEVDAWMRCRLHSMNTSLDEFCSWAVKKI